MSELPGLDLEDFLGWWFGYTTPEMITQWECVREGIETNLERFKPEEQSWREVGSAIFEIYESTVYAQEEN